MSRWKVILGAVVGGLAVLWAVLFLTIGGDFYRSVEEVKSGSGNPGSSQNVRVGGAVAGAVEQEGSEIRFAIEGESGEQLQVNYAGPYPERLEPGAEVVASGFLSSGGRFETTEVLIKCPDKLFAEKATNRVLTGSGLERLLY